MKTLTEGQRRRVDALRIASVAIGLAVMCAASTASVQGQLARDPVLNHALRQAAGMRSFGDMLMDVASSAADVRRVTGDLTARIRSARTRFWNAYPAGNDLPAARRELEALLASKDRVYLSNEISGMGTVVFDVLGAGVDDGIAPGGYDAFQQWAKAVTKNLQAEGPNLATAFIGSATPEEVARFKQLIDRADPLYKAYVVRRDLEEFRMQGTTPPGWDAEAWRLAMLAWKTRESGLGIPDPYAEALTAFERGATFPRQCTAQLQKVLGIAPKAAACDCLHRAFTSTLSPRDLWQLETSFSAEQLVAAATRRVGLHERVAACVR